YNLKLMGILLGVTTIVFLLLTTLIPFLNWIGAQLKFLFKQLVYFLFKLFFLNPEFLMKLRKPIAPPQGEPPPLFDLGPRSPNFPTVVAIIVQVIGLCLFVLLICHLINKIMQKRSTKITKLQNVDYTDTECVVASSKNLAPLKSKDARRHWKKEYRTYLKTVDCVEKFHIGYLLAIQGLTLCDLPLTQSDTTCEIDAMAQPVLQDSLYHCVTEIYNGITYGKDEYTAKTMGLLNNSLAQIAAIHNS
ncbi:MAG: hypothetical protein WAX04_05835, partial [Oscillospiraceae bacterium]